MLSFFESRSRRERDAMEVRRLFRQYGDKALGVLNARIRDPSLSRRDRRHWRRLLRKAKHRKNEFLTQS